MEKKVQYIIHVNNLKAQNSQTAHSWHKTFLHSMMSDWKPSMNNEDKTSAVKEKKTNIMSAY